MAIASTGVYEEKVGGETRRLVLRNGEIERFELQYDFGVFQLFDQLFGRGDAPKVSHVRDIVALALVGGGMTDREADALISSLPPSENMALRQTAQRVLGVTFIPAALTAGDKKKAAGSPVKKSSAKSDTAPQSVSEISAV
ncbi:hypothetical protein AQS8620_01299 [Aquimixticola soesokkakensis]|uniref:Phage tail tube protein, GTA-gp10 n=1 Tax=Aquimixticola soesokkakensis TaxID=1519096 RepID=A0A1Y5SAZ2_9RHOB|nr:GTA-gp10 family protein [Aquimixticola soesokkakensis]SLN36555.1 hypothetical protein AQS8620_01299 [Aquimixticola soesokkakensis]